MKKSLFVLLCAVMCGCCSVQGADFTEKLLFYVPNRIVDALDCFSLNLGVGLGVRAELQGTRAVTVGGGIQDNVFTLYKDYNRQYGGGIQSGWYWSLIAGEEDMRRDPVFGWVRPYWDSFGWVDGDFSAGIPSPEGRSYDPIDGARDYWQIGGALGGLIFGEVYLHPIEGFDFVLGFFLIDFKNDDLTIADFQ